MAGRGARRLRAARRDADGLRAQLGHATLTTTGRRAVRASPGCSRRRLPGTVLLHGRRAGGRGARVREEDPADPWGGPQDGSPPREAGAWWLSMSTVRSPTSTMRFSRGPGDERASRRHTPRTPAPMILCASWSRRGPGRASPRSRWPPSWARPRARSRGWRASPDPRPPSRRSTGTPARWAVSSRYVSSCDSATRPRGVGLAGVGAAPRYGLRSPAADQAAHAVPGERRRLLQMLLSVPPL